LSNWSFSKP